MRYQVNDHIFEYHTEEQRSFGDPLILSEHAVDLTKQMGWHKMGFTIEKLFTSEEQPTFLQETTNLLYQLWRTSGLVVPDNFPLDQYHLLVNQEQHINAINFTKLVTVKQFPIGIYLLEERISAIMNQKLKVLNPFDNQSVFHFRVIRPLSGDNNPLHRDVWLEDYKDCINLYIPIAGSNGLSSLIISPGSHLWPESKVERTKKGALINEQRFNVPAVTEISGEFEFKRPDPNVGEVLLFSPYLIHGGSVNLNKDITRISIEVRLWKK